jgi:hypothetical protein
MLQVSLTATTGGHGPEGAHLHWGGGSRGRGDITHLPCMAHRGKTVTL